MEVLRLNKSQDLCRCLAKNYRRLHQTLLYDAEYMYDVLLQIPF